jgi:hypothetical protein
MIRVIDGEEYVRVSDLSEKVQQHVRLNIAAAKLQAARAPAGEPEGDAEEGDDDDGKQDDGGEE